MNNESQIEYFCDNVCGYWYGEDCTITSCPVRDYLRWKETDYDKHTCEECVHVRGNFCMLENEVEEESCYIGDRKSACTYFKKKCEENSQTKLKMIKLEF